MSEMSEQISEILYGTLYWRITIFRLLKIYIIIVA